MRRSFNPSLSLGDPRKALQTLAGVLLALNLVAGWFVIRPLGGSAEDLEQEARGLRAQLAQRRNVLQLTRVNVSKVEGARTQGDRFMDEYFLSRRIAATLLVSELNDAAREANIRMKLSSVSEEPIEGSDTLSMLIITGEYEGTYKDLLAAVNRIDRSRRLLILESLQATPQQGSAGVLNIGMKIDAFVREDSGAPITLEAPPERPSTAAPIAAAPKGAQPASTVPQPQPVQAPVAQNPAPAVMKTATPPPAPKQEIAPGELGGPDPFATEAGRASRRRRPRPGDEQ
jgi:hypothetical protein